MLRVALEAVALLSSVCGRIAIAGSIRRGKDNPGDIEIVCRPKFAAAAVQTQLWGVARPGEQINLLDNLAGELLEGGVFTKRLNKNSHPIAWGERFKAVTFRGVPLDVFIVLPDRQWGPTMVIRTGPGSANEALVTTVGMRTRNGVAGVLPKGLRFAEGAVWRGSERLDTPEEVDVFRAVELPYVRPDLRSAEAYQAWAKRRAEIRAGWRPLPVWGMGDDLWRNGERFRVEVAGKVVGEGA